MSTIHSARARGILEKPKFFVSTPPENGRGYQRGPFHINVGMNLEGELVKNLSYQGTVSDVQKIILESMAHLLIGKRLSLLESLTVRECEAWLRDRNSEPAITGMTELEESQFKDFFSWLRKWGAEKPGSEYHFSSEKGPFRRLPLVEKIRELKAFFSSVEILTLYKNLPRPEVVDVDGLTVYVSVPYGSERERALFEGLHLLGVETFQEENLNFIPEP